MLRNLSIDSDCPDLLYLLYNYQTPEGGPGSSIVLPICSTPFWSIIGDWPAAYQLRCSKWNSVFVTKSEVFDNGSVTFNSLFCRCWSSHLEIRLRIKLVTPVVQSQCPTWTRHALGYRLHHLVLIRIKGPEAQQKQFLRTPVPTLKSNPKAPLLIICWFGTFFPHFCHSGQNITMISAVCSNNQE